MGEALLQMVGTAASPLHDVQVRGLTFNYSTWTQPNDTDGYAPELAGFTYGGTGGAAANNPDLYRKTPGAVQLSHTAHVWFERDAFARLGGAGIDVQDASQHDTVSGCDFTDISSTAVQIGGVKQADHHPAVATERMLDTAVSNNFIHESGAEYEDGVGVFVGYTESTRVTHNEIAGMPYSGIVMGLGFGYKDQGGRDGYTTPTTARDNVVDHNYIHDIMGVLIDGGGIYTENKQPGSSVSDNYLTNAGQSNGSLYLDEASSSIAFARNVIRQTPRWLLIQTNSAQNTVTDTFTDTATLDNRAPASNPVTNTTQVTNGVWPSAARSVMDAAGLERAYEDLVGDRSFSVDDSSGPDAPLDDTHGRVDFGKGAWRREDTAAGFSTTGHAFFATAGTSRSFTLRPNRVLTGITLEGTGSYTLSDGTNTKSGALGGIGTPTVVQTGWTTGGSLVTVTLSAGYNAVVDDIRDRRVATAITYSFPEATATGTAIDGLHSAVDFPTGDWIGDPSYPGYALTTYGYFATSLGTSRTFVIPDAKHLSALRLEGTGTYSLSDGVNPTRSGSLAGVGSPVAVATNWTQPGPEVTVTLSAGYAAVVDDLAVAG